MITTAMWFFANLSTISKWEMILPQFRGDYNKTIALCFTKIGSLHPKKWPSQILTVFSST
jgi:hypothetical protein